MQLVAAGQEGSGRIALARVRGKPSYGLGVFGTRRRQQCQQCQECVVVAKSRSRSRARYVWKRKGWENVPVEGRRVSVRASRQTREALAGNDDDDDCFPSPNTRRARQAKSDILLLPETNHSSTPASILPSPHFSSQAFAVPPPCT